MEFRNSFCLPQTKKIYLLCPVADNRHIIRHRINILTLKMHQHLVCFCADRPWVSCLSPVIRIFLLETVFDGLLEEPVLITDTIAV